VLIIIQMPSRGKGLILKLSGAEKDE